MTEMGSSPQDLIAPATAAQRTGSPRDMFFVWGGVNVAATNLAAGGLGVTLGLSLRDVVLVYILGGAIGAITLGLCVAQGKRTGAPVMVNARPAFGYYGAYVLAALLFVMSAGWFGVNSFFGMTAARGITAYLGVPQGPGTDLVLLVIIIGIQVVIAIYGFNLIRRFERVAVYGMFTAFAVVAGFAASGQHINWAHPGGVQGLERFGTIVVLVSALGAGWALSWTPWAHDFGRFVRNDASDRKTFWYAWGGMFLLSLFTFSLSAAIATTAGGFDVGGAVAAVMPAGVAIPVLLVMTLGLISANVVPLFSGGYALLTMGIRLDRRLGTVATGLVGLAIPVFGVFQASFAQTFHNWMIGLLIWISPWFAITMVDYFGVHRGHYSHADLYSVDGGSGGRLFSPGLAAWVVGFLAGWAVANTPVFTSPLATMYLGGADLSIYVAALVAVLIYYPWAVNQKKGKLEPLPNTYRRSEGVSG